jgi:hypothetical protein
LPAGVGCNALRVPPARQKVVQGGVFVTAEIPEIDVWGRKSREGSTKVWLDVLW